MNKLILATAIVVLCASLADVGAQVKPRGLPGRGPLPIVGPVVLVVVPAQIIQVPAGNVVAVTTAGGRYIGNSGAYTITISEQTVTIPFPTK